MACVLTGDDFPDGRMGAFIKDEHAIAKGKVRYPGEPVAVVAAEDEETARRAAALVRIDYEELPVAATPEDAMAPDAPLIHEGLADYFKVFPAICGGNIASETELSEGDVDSAWADCDIIVEGDYETPAQAHLSIEPVGALAEADPAGRVTLWSANQSVFRVQANVCESLQLPMSKLRCLTPKVGAGFGNKMEPHVQPLAVQLALKTGRPVKLILNRTEDFEMVRARHPFKIRCKTGARKDGTLLARELSVILDCGAYGDDSPGVLGYSLLMSRGPYRIPHCRCSGKLVYTNRMRFGAFRGFGNPQVTFATESQIDEIAGQLGMDPLDLRAKNMIQPGDRWFGGGEVASNGLAECIEKARAAAGWQQGGALAAPPGKRRALGVAACAHISGLLATGAIVRLLEDGSVVLNTGAVDIGQGSDTVLTQMCASALKVPVDRVAIASPDTDGSPYNWGTTASRVTYTTGRSVVAAADRVAEQVKRHASEIFECAAGDLELREGGRVGIVGVPERELSFFEVSARAHWAAGGPHRRHRHLGLQQAERRSQTRHCARPALPADRGLQLRLHDRGGRNRRDDRQGRRRRGLVGNGCRQGDQSRLGRGPDRGRLRPGHGLRTHRGDGVRRAAPREPVDDGLQGADHARFAVRYPFDHRRGRRARRAVRRQGGSARSGWCRAGGDRQCGGGGYGRAAAPVAPDAGTGAGRLAGGRR